MSMSCCCWWLHTLQIGTYQTAIVASALKVPFYVAAESYKFARIFPLGQRDIPERAQHGRSFAPCRPDVAIPRSTRVCAMSCVCACVCVCAR
jgi:translation initiation factor 2B subunit (eIF-2B alpha/beta/delta family)